MQTTTIQPIVNGSANPNLTPELFNDLDFPAKRQVIWSIMVSMGFAHSFSEVDPRCFEKPDKKFEYSSITEENANELFVTVRETFNAHHNRMKAKTANLHYELGAKIYAAQKELGFGGMLELDKNRLKGYISACGNWNDFNASNVGAAIGRMHELAPRRDYGPNNPNTGSIMHTLKTLHGCEYIILNYDYVSADDVVRIQSFYKNHWEPKGKSIKADSVRIEVSDHGHGYYGVELIWWWD